MVFITPRAYKNRLAGINFFSCFSCIFFADISQQLFFPFCCVFQLSRRLFDLWPGPLRFFGGVKAAVMMSCPGVLSFCYPAILLTSDVMSTGPEGFGFGLGLGFGWGFGFLFGFSLGWTGFGFGCGSSLASVSVSRAQGFRSGAPN